MRRTNVAMVSAHITTEDLELLSELIEAGKVRPQIDRRYPFTEIPAAIRYLEQGHERAWWSSARREELRMIHIASRGSVQREER